MSDLFNHYSEEGPERCGLILMGGVILECDNIHPEPETGFEIDPETVLKHEADIEGTWHTHPGQSAILSGEDHLCFTQWPRLDHYIVGNDSIRIYRVKSGAVIDADHIPR